MTTKPVIILFHRDLRLSQHPALNAAIETGRPLIPFFALEENEFGPAARWWLHHSLARLEKALAQRRLRLTLRRGPRIEAAMRLISETRAAAIFWNRRYDAPAAEKAFEAAMRETGATAKAFNGALLRAPGDVLTQSGAPFRVFTPFWKRLRALGPADAEPQAAANDLVDFEPAPASETLSDWKLTPSRPDWAAAFSSVWTPGEAGARAALTRFLDGAAKAYADLRDRPGADGVSRLSPHLAFGEVAPGRIWRAVLARVAAGEIGERHAEKFLSEIAWREFSHNLLFFNPDLPVTPLRREFVDFPWKDDVSAFRAWTAGKTGYPFVDAGMRQLWRTGWMHNRARMTAASFLVKDLLIDWRRGERWFRETLVDADRANNAANWQWVAGCGAEAAPFFRIFNPVVQGERFDPDGDFVRQFVPELSELPARFVHKPWLAPKEILDKAGVELGKTYPAPIVDHAAARQRALDCFRSIRRS